MNLIERLRNNAKSEEGLYNVDPKLLEMAAARIKDIGHLEQLESFLRKWEGLLAGRDLRIKELEAELEKYKTLCAERNGVIERMKLDTKPPTR